MQNKIFYSACFGFAAGVLTRSFLHVDGFLALSIGFVSIFPILLLFSIIISKRSWGILLSVFVLAFSLGILRFHFADKPAPEVFEKYVSQKVSLSGMIVDEPAKSETGVKLILRTTAAGPKTGIVIFAKQDAGYRYGDEVQVSGVLRKPKNFMTDQGLEFDYVNYLRKDGVFYTMRNPEIEVLSSGHGNVIKRALFSMKERFDRAMAYAIPAPESTVMGGIILGERAAFSPSLRQSFMDTGTIHIVTIGGYHVTLVAQWIMKIMGFLPRYAGIGAGMVSMFLYVIVTGGAQTSIRAGIMAALALLAVATGRIYQAGRALVLAAIVMILVNPFVLAYDVSFELSFMATIAIIFLSPRIEPYFQWISWKWLRDIVAISAAMYIFALPFILYRMGILSLVALPANILIVPLLPATMIAGFITGFAGLISPLLAFIPGKIAYALLYYQITAIGILAHLSFAALAIADFPLWLVVLIYAIFLYILFGEKTKEETAANPRVPRFPGVLNVRFFLLVTPLLLTLIASGLIYYSQYRSNQAREKRLGALLTDASALEPMRPFTADARIKSDACVARGGLPDHACTPGAVFEGATVEQICVRGYTATIRNVSTNLRKEVYAEYGVSYPQPRGAYEVDHFVPLSLGGSNDIANLFLEAAEPRPGFHEKDLVEVFLQQEVCNGRVALPVAQRQIAVDWLAVYNNLSPQQITTLKKKYRGN